MEHKVSTEMQHALKLEERRDGTVEDKIFDLVCEQNTKQPPYKLGRAYEMHEGTNWMNSQLSTHFDKNVPGVNLAP